MPGVDLGHQPVSDLILTRAQLNRPETFYPMQLHHCPDCGLTQLGYIVSPKVVYKNFPFVSGTTRTATEHLQGLARLLVEIGSLGQRLLRRRHRLERRDAAQGLRASRRALPRHRPLG